MARLFANILFIVALPALIDAFNVVKQTGGNFPSTYGASDNFRFEPFGTDTEETQVEKKTASFTSMATPAKDMDVTFKGSGESQPNLGNNNLNSDEFKHGHLKQYVHLR
mmetsp:Transcript_15223/g.21710  ORF Transcript_15223/g.21710 Transcript_15223/m.21710 type:complete len:109 (+) Transcript_15223:134-460(+)